MLPHTYCHFCGSKHLTENWPRTCGVCSRTTWDNPLPVVVAIIPVSRKGILTVRRNIEPQKGRLALPGGYIDHAETWQAAAHREVLEEVGIDINPRLFTLFGVESSSNRNTILVFGKTPEMPDFADLDFSFVPNTEVSEIQFLKTPETLAFPTHTEMLTRAMMELTWLM